MPKTVWPKMVATIDSQLQAFILTRFASSRRRVTMRTSAHAAEEVRKVAKKGRVARPKMCISSRSCAPALSMVAGELGWSVQTVERDDCQLYWVTTVEQLQDRLPLLRAGQAVTRIPGMHDVAQKCTLTRLMNLGQKLFPGDFSFYPQTYILPEDAERMHQELQNSAASFIVKPADGAQGDGIYVAPSYGELATRLRGLASQTPTVVQHYLSRPLLLDGFKFDLRVYVFVASVQPLEVWVCREGLARFCTEKYVAPTGKNCHRVCAHLTNYSLNKRSDAFVKFRSADPVAEEHRGGGSPLRVDSSSSRSESVFAELVQADGSEEGSSKRPISHVMQELEKKGYDAEAMWGQVGQLVSGCVRVCACVSE